MARPLQKITATMIPQLSIASSGALADLERRIFDGTAAIELEETAPTGS